MMKRGLRFREWLRYYWLFVFGVSIIIFFISQLYITQKLTVQKEAEYDNSVRIVGQHIDSSLKVVDDFIYETFVDSTHLFRLVNSTQSSERETAKMSIANSLQSISGWSDVLDGMVFYAPQSIDRTVIEAGDPSNYQIRKAVKEVLTNGFGEGVPIDILNNRGYMALNADGKSYIVRIIKLQGCYFASCISTGTFFDSLSGVQEGTDSILFISDEDGTVVAQSDGELTHIDTADGGSYINIGKNKYLQIGYQSEKTGFHFGILADRRTVIGEVRNFQITFALVFCMLMIFFPLSIVFIKRFMEKPLTEINSGMKRVGQGEWDIELADNSRVLEFEEVTQAFNGMVREVHDLKIKNYETELKNQKANLQYLQLQTKPHFYANALNIIYSLAQIKDFAAIQKMSTVLAEYSRYMFSDATSLVSLNKELTHVNNFMEIQYLRYNGRICYEEDIEEGIGSAMVPPFVLQSFVENSIKYAFDERETLWIRVEARADRANDVLILTVRDNGNGYPEEILSGYYTSEDGATDTGGRRIGLKNVQERLRLIFGKTACMKLSNDDGSVSRVHLPLIMMDVN